MVVKFNFTDMPIMMYGITGGKRELKRLKEYIDNEVATRLERLDGVASAMVWSPEEAEILINATSVGMIPDSEESLVPAQLLIPDLVVFDIVYNPIRTKLLKEAKAAGAQTISGIDMLAWQGALAFEKWTEQPAPLDLMRKEAIKALERHED